MRLSREFDPQTIMISTYRLMDTAAALLVGLQRVVRRERKGTRFICASLPGFDSRDDVDTLA